jgi:hypothetical protein
VGLATADLVHNACSTFLGLEPLRFLTCTVVEAAGSIFHISSPYFNIFLNKKIFLKNIKKQKLPSSKQSPKLLSHLS